METSVPPFLLYLCFGPLSFLSVQDRLTPTYALPTASCIKQVCAARVCCTDSRTGPFDAQTGVLSSGRVRRLQHALSSISKAGAGKDLMLEVSPIWEQCRIVSLWCWHAEGAVTLAFGIGTSWCRSLCGTRHPCWLIAAPLLLGIFGVCHQYGSRHCCLPSPVL